MKVLDLKTKNNFYFNSPPCFPILVLFFNDVKDLTVRN